MDLQWGIVNGEIQPRSSRWMAVFPPPICRSYFTRPLFGVQTVSGEFRIGWVSILQEFHRQHALPRLLCNRETRTHLKFSMQQSRWRRATCAATILWIRTLRAVRMARYHGAGGSRA